MKQRTKLPSALLKTLICVAALAWVSNGVQWSALSDIRLAANPALLAAALGIFLTTPVLQGIRLRRLLASQDIAIGVVESVRLAFAGNFMNFAAPIGSTTGDVFKAIYLGRRTRHSWEAAAITFVDRGIGLSTLLISVTLLAWLSGPASPLAVLRGYLAAISVVLVAGVAAFLFLGTGGVVGRVASRLPKREELSRVAAATRTLFLSPGVLLLACLDTVGIHLAAAASFLCVALGLGFGLGVADWPSLYATFSAGELVRALPGPPQGLGTMEMAYSYFFATWALPAQIISGAVVIRMVMLISSLPGAAFAFGWKPAPQATPAETTPLPDVALQAA
jgi:uncharacterized protein (TIRG00374 family)